MYILNPDTRPTEVQHCYTGVSTRGTVTIRCFKLKMLSIYFSTNCCRYPTNLQIIVKVQPLGNAFPIGYTKNKTNSCDWKWLVFTRAVSVQWWGSSNHKSTVLVVGSPNSSSCPTLSNSLQLRWVQGRNLYILKIKKKHLKLLNICNVNLNTSYHYFFSAWLNIQRVKGIREFSSVDTYVQYM
jgi:hypothetical protein